MTSPSCARPACSGVPAAWLAYDYEARCAWLDDQLDDGADHSHRWALCERHADTLRVPRGWFCVDRRLLRGGVTLDSSGQEVVVPRTRAGRKSTGLPAGRQSASPEPVPDVPAQGVPVQGVLAGDKGRHSPTRRRATGVPDGPPVSAAATGARASRTPAVRGATTGPVLASGTGAGGEGEQLSALL